LVFLIHTELRCTVNHTSDLQKFIVVLYANVSVRKTDKNACHTVNITLLQGQH